MHKTTFLKSAGLFAMLGRTFYKAQKDILKCSEELFYNGQKIFLISTEGLCNA
jgi:hypothetical protein